MVSLKASVLFYNSREKWSAFQLEAGIRRWGILMLTTAGRYTLELPETGQSFTVLPNTVAYIPPNTRFARKIEQPIDFHQFHMQSEPEDPIAASLVPGILPIPKEQVSAIGRSLSCAKTAPCQTEVLQHILDHILAENYLFSDQATDPIYSEDVLRVLRYMEDHLSEPIKLENLAQIAGLSPTGLIWKFDRQMKTTPMQYLIRLRMQLAKQLLLESNLTVTQIAEKCGYADVYYFSNAFRQHTGINPTAFRQSPMA